MDISHLFLGVVLLSIFIAFRDLKRGNTRNKRRRKILDELLRAPSLSHRETVARLHEMNQQKGRECHDFCFVCHPEKG